MGGHMGGRSGPSSSGLAQERLVLEAATALVQLDETQLGQPPPTLPAPFDWLRSTPMHGPPKRDGRSGQAPVPVLDRGGRG